MYPNYFIFIIFLNKFTLPKTRQQIKISDSVITIKRVSFSGVFCPAPPRICHTQPCAPARHNSVPSTCVLIRKQLEDTPLEDIRRVAAAHLSFLICVFVSFDLGKPARLVFFGAKTVTRKIQVVSVRRQKLRFKCGHRTYPFELNKRIHQRFLKAQ